MAKIIRKEHIREDITTGDVFVTKDYCFRLILLEENNYALLDIQNAIVAKKVEHVAHAINWVKKHYGEFTIVANNDIEVTFK